MKYLKKNLLKVVSIFMLVFFSCNQKSIEIECICEYIILKTDQEKLNDFIELEGVEVWKGWGNLTREFAEERNKLDECGIHKYLAAKNLNSNETKGKLYFIFSVHSYLKYGVVKNNEIKEIINLILKE